MPPSSNCVKPRWIKGWKETSMETTFAPNSSRIYE